jgi:ADP-ribose pyrophosphatase YjhB (NUDIX family)
VKDEEGIMKRDYPTRPIVGVGATIVNGGKLLFEKRKEMPRKGKWTVPGGLVELGETLEETVIREAKEETSLSVENPELFDVLDNVILDETAKVKYHYVIVDYYVHVKDGHLKAADDAAELRWASFNEVEDYDLTERFRKFFRREGGIWKSATHSESNVEK